MQHPISRYLALAGVVMLSACSSSGNSTSSLTPGTFSQHTAVFLNNSTVWSWGGNESGQLGNGSTVYSSLPIRVVARFGGYSGNSVSVGANHTLAFQKYSTIRSWGLNNYGQLGNGSILNSSLPVTIRKNGSQESLSGIVSVAAGGYHSLAVDRNGIVWSWGSNTMNELGRSVFTNMSTNVAGPVHLADPLILIIDSPVPQIRAVSAGGSHSLALAADGRVWGWGYNAEGQLGQGNTDTQSVPVPITALDGKNIIAIAAGGIHSLALAADGSVWSWGANYFGQLGDGTTTKRATPEKVQNISGITMIAAGISHSLAYNESTDTLYAWGFNNNGQLGDGTTLEKKEPVPITNFSLKATGGTLPQAIFATGHHSHARDTKGVWWSWGDNFSGQLGIGTTDNNSSVPVQVRGL